MKRFDPYWKLEAPSYSMLRMEEHPEVGGDTACVGFKLPYTKPNDLSPNLYFPGLSVWDIWCVEQTIPKVSRRSACSAHIKITVFVTNNSLQASYLKSSRWDNPRFMGRRPQPPSNRHPSSSGSSHQAEGTECKSWICDRLCRVEEARIGSVFAVVWFIY